MMQPPPRYLALAVSAMPKLRPRTHVRCRPRSRSQHQTRSFVNSFPTRATMGDARMPKDITSWMPKQQGMKSRMQNLSSGEMQNDLGLIPKTFIRPPSEDLPAFFGRDFLQRLRIEKLAMRSVIQNAFTHIYMTKWGGSKDPGTGKRRKLPLLLRERTEVARRLHQDFYTALASGDMPTIRQIACHGLVQSSNAQIETRNAWKKPRQKFQVQRYLGFTYPQWMRWPLLTILPFHSTKIMSDRMLPIPLGRDSWLRQYVVRLRSKQSLDRNDGNGPVTRDLTEYIVIQKISWNGQEESWKIWGTVQPSSMAEIQDWLSDNTSPISGFTESLKTRMRSWGAPV